MATINEHVSAIRGLIKKYENTTHFTNEMIYFHLTQAAAIVNKQKAEKYEELSEWNTPTYCIGTESTTQHPCECLEEVGCKMIRTKYKIPKPLVSKHRTMMRVMTLDHKIIPNIKPEMADVYQLDEIKKDQLFYFIQNEYVYIVNGTPKSGKPKALLIKGYWEDISDWVGIKLCDPEGTDTDEYCFDMDAHEFPMDQDSTYRAYDYVLQKLGIALQLKSDDLNNSNPEL